MHRMLTLPDYLEIPNHPMDWLVAPPSFQSNSTTAIAEAYSRTDRLNSGIKNNLRGLDRYIGGTSNVADAFAPIGAYTKAVRGQQRVFINDPRGQQYQLLLRRGDPVPLGFETAECGPVIEQFSFLADESLKNESGEPFNTSALYIHRLAPEQPGHIEVWFVPEWRCREGDTLIECSLSVYLGTALFRDTPSDDIEPEGDTPDL